MGKKSLVIYSLFDISTLWTLFKYSKIKGRVNYYSPLFFFVFAIIMKNMISNSSLANKNWNILIYNIECYDALRNCKLDEIRLVLDRIFGNWDFSTG